MEDGHKRAAPVPVRARLFGEAAGEGDSVAPGAVIRTVIGPLGDADHRLGAAWADLARHAAEPNAFAEPWFVMAGVRHLPLPPSLRLIEVWRGDRLVGLMPVEVAARYGRMRVRHVTNWLHHHSFLGTPLVRGGEEQGFWLALLAALDGADWAPGFLHVNGMVEQGPVHRGLIAAADELGRRCDIVHRTVRAQLEAGLTPEAYYEANVRKKKRKELKRLAVRLAEQGEVVTRSLAADAGTGEVQGWCEDFLALERSGWKGRAGSALASGDATRAFFCDMLAGAHRAGRLDLLRIDVDGHAVAMLVNFITPPGAFSFKIAFDEDYARFSPGVLVQLENLRLLGNEAVRWMDSCAVENHPMIDSLWSGRLPVVRVTVPLAGVRRQATFAVCRTLEDISARRRQREEAK